MKRVSWNVCSRKCFQKFREWGIPLPFHFIPRLFVPAFPPHLRHAKKKHPSGRRRKIISALTFDRNSTFFLSLYVRREDFFVLPSLKILSTILFDAARVWHCGFEGTTNVVVRDAPYPARNLGDNLFLMSKTLNCKGRPTSTRNIISRSNQFPSLPE